eukprot:2668698-Amphidinium_carterae.1
MLAGVTSACESCESRHDALHLAMLHGYGSMGELEQYTADSTDVIGMTKLSNCFVRRNNFQDLVEMTIVGAGSNASCVQAIGAHADNPNLNVGL